MTQDLAIEFAPVMHPQQRLARINRQKNANIIGELPPVARLAQHTRARKFRQLKSLTKLRNSQNNFF